MSPPDFKAGHAAAVQLFDLLTAAEHEVLTLRAENARLTAEIGRLEDALFEAEAAE